MIVERPDRLEDAVRVLGDGGAPWVPIAGGTDLLVAWPRRATQQLRLLDLSRLGGELGGWRLTATHLELGALTTYWDVIAAHDVAAAFPLLVQAAQQVGSLQIQTRGTWAGNIGNGSPAADGVLALLAYDASVILRSAAGSREVALHAYWTGYKQAVRRPDELIVSIRLPRRVRSLEWLHKVGARSAQTITKVGAAVVHDEEGWRVAANSVAPMVCRCRQFEAALGAGRRFGDAEELRRALAADIAPIDDLRSTAEYRGRVLARLLYHRLFAPAVAAQ